MTAYGVLLQQCDCQEGALWWCSHLVEVRETQQQPIAWQGLERQQVHIGRQLRPTLQS